MSKQKIGDAYYGKTAYQYEEKRKVEDIWQYEQAIVKNLLNHIPDETTVLDLPIGTGRFVDFYLEKNMQVHGLEISKDMITAAEQNLGPLFASCNVVIADATKKLPYTDNVFDAVVSFRFLKFFSYHVARNILREFHRVSRGKVILSMKLRRPDRPQEGFVEELDSIGEKLDEDEVIKLFHETGFTVEKKVRIAKPGKRYKQNNGESMTARVFRHFHEGTFWQAMVHKLYFCSRTGQSKVSAINKDDQKKQTRPGKERVAYLLKKIDLDKPGQNETGKESW